jgi:hypothetical protein
MVKAKAKCISCLGVFVTYKLKFKDKNDHGGGGD